MRLWIALACICVASACLPLRTYYAEGVSFATLERDNTRGDVAALRDAPVANVVRQGPPRFIRLPACPPGVADAAPPGPSAVLPRLTPQSCAIRREGGGFRIVNQG